MSYIRLPMQRIPEGTSDAIRLQLYFDYCQFNQAVNPDFNLPLGVKKRWYHLFKCEHPFTSRLKLPSR